MTVKGRLFLSIAIVTRFQAEISKSTQVTGSPPVRIRNHMWY